MVRETNPRCKGMSVEEVCTIGTPVQKAYKAIMEYSDAVNQNEPDVKPRINRKERDEIVRSLTPDEYSIFRLYHQFYGTLLEAHTRFALLSLSYEKEVETLRGMYAALATEEYVLTEVYLHLPPEERESILKRPNAKLDVVRDSDGDIHLMYKETDTQWWEMIQKQNKRVNAEYADLKGMVLAVESFIDDYKKKHPRASKTILKLFVPSPVRYLIDRAKSDYVGSLVPELSKKVVREKIQRGEKVDSHEITRALVEDYDSIIVAPFLTLFWRQRIERCYIIAKRMYIL